MPSSPCYCLANGATRLCGTCTPALGGAAPSAPTTDAHMIHGLERCIAAAHRLLDEHHDATVADRQDAEDAARLLAELRGGATAPTPDDPTDAAVQLAKDLFGYGQHGAACPKSVCGDGDCLCCDCGFAEAQSLAAAVLNGLRRDTGASHE